MARGFESKSVESQQSERFERSERGGETGSREDIERRSKRDSLQMSRRRVESELAASKSEVHRTALQNALRYLDDELAKL
jgi:hypothetical protein